jgi:hypothetical protein
VYLYSLKFSSVAYFSSSAAAAIAGGPSFIRDYKTTTTQMGNFNQMECASKSRSKER